MNPNTLPVNERISAMRMRVSAKKEAAGSLFMEIRKGNCAAGKSSGNKSSYQQNITQGADTSPEA